MTGKNQAKQSIAVIYARVSSTQQKTQGHGLESQEVRCREFATYKDYQVVEVFRDDASGSLTDRPGMKAMLTFLRRQRGDTIVIVDDISRLARSLEAHIKLRAAIASVGGILQSPSIEFGEDSDSQLVENLLASVSQHQRQKNADQTKNRMRARAMAGYWPMRAPIGYKFERVAGHGKMMVPDEPVASVIREGLEGFASGRFGLQSEVMRFFASHPSYPAKARSCITVERVREMMNRPIYAGKITISEWGLHLVDAKHRAIISYETFLRVQERMKGAAKAPARKDLNRDFPLRGWVSCGGCGKPLMGCWSTGRSARHAYYLCQRKDCPDYGKSIKRDDLESEFAELLRSMRPSVSLFNLAVGTFRYFWNERSLTRAEQVRSFKQDVSSIDKKIGQYLDRIVEIDSRSLVKNYEDRLHSLERDKALITERIANCGRPLGEFDATFRTAVEFLGNPCNLWESPQLEDKRAVLKLVFAEPLAYRRGSGFRTAVTSSPFKILSDLQNGGEGMVPRRGLEPPRPCERQHLKLVRLPIPPSGHGVGRGP